MEVLRMWGSVGYAVISIILGVTVGVYFMTETVFLFMIPLIVILIFLCRENGKMPMRPAVTKDTAAKVSGKRGEKQEKSADY